ncbi:MAG: VWA domain-containing protein [Alistipes sp.]
MYKQSITRAHRTAFIIAMDCSGSMAQELFFMGRSMSKAEAVAEVTNRLLFELIERARRSDGVRHYYDIAVVGYSGDGVVPMLPDKEGFIPVNVLAAQQVAMQTRTSEYRLPNGEIALRKHVIPCWIKPLAKGETPMYDALLYLRDLVAGWVGESDHAGSFPPVIFNITDGESSDGDDDGLREVCEQIKALHTLDGNVLLINIHLAAGDTEQSVIFPTAEEANYTNRYATLLFDCSSEMPETMTEAIREVKTYGAMPPFRGMSFNASIAELLTILNIGSISVSIQ